MRCRAGVVAAAAALAFALVASGAAAEPALAVRLETVWGHARRPDTARRRDMIAEAESYVRRWQDLDNSRLRHERADVDVLGDSYLMRAAELFEQAGAAASSDLFLRYRLAEVYSLREQRDKEVAALEGITRADPPAPLRARVFADLAVAYAHSGRVEDEIRAYGEALRVQPRAEERSRLIANRAEAYMLLGDSTTAVAGYRAALALLSNDLLMFGSGPTTLWGMAVGLDRADELDPALEAVRLARVYDPQDKRINSSGWFYLPEYDRHWYEALGHWQVARKADVVASLRADAYLRALGSWARYIAAASAVDGDKWVRQARVRLLQCARERADFLQRQDVRKLVGGTPDPEFVRLMASLRGRSDDDARRLLVRFLAQHPAP